MYCSAAACALRDRTVSVEPTMTDEPYVEEMPTHSISEYDILYVFIGVL
jgi:hypothetical protein